MKRMSSIIIGLMVFSAVFAAGDITFNPTLVLHKFKKIKMQEKSGDELYFDIGVFNEPNSAQFLRFPAYPEHWPTEKFSALQPTEMWTEALKNNQSIVLNVSLMEQDLFPLNPDDLIGIVRLKLKNDKGILRASWSIPNRGVAIDEVIKKNGAVQKFELVGPKSKYEVYLSLKNN